MVEDVYRLRELKQRSKVLTAEMVEVSNRIKVSMQSASVGTINGEKAVTWTSYRRGGYTVDAADIRPLKLATPKEDT